MIQRLNKIDVAFIAVTGIFSTICVHILNKLNKINFRCEFISDSLIDIKKDVIEKISKFVEKPGVINTNILIKKYNVSDDYIDLYTVNDIAYDRPVLSFSETTKLDNFVNTLYENKCFCGILYKGHENKEITAILDTIDIVTYILRFGEYNPEAVLSTCKQKLVYVYDNCNLSDAMQYLKSGFRYIIVKNTEDHSIISQGSVLRYMYSNNVLHNCMTLNKTLLDLQICSRQVLIYCGESDKVLDTYQLMLQHNITSIPILNANGECVFVLSIHDVIEAIVKDIDFNMTCIEFGKRLYKEISPILASVDSTLKDVFDLIMYHRIHHVYVQENGKLIGVVSYIDIIKILF